MDSQLTDEPTQTQTQFFFPEWVSAVFYGGQWQVVKLGTFKDGIVTDRGEMAVYQDPFDDGLVFVIEPITGFRVKKPVPPEPKASVTELHPHPKK